MSAVNTNLFNSLKAIRHDLSAIEPGAESEIASVGASIEQMMTDYEEGGELEPIRDLPVLCLTALQRLYEDQSADFAGIMQAIDVGFVAAEQAVASRDNAVCRAMVDQACEMLRFALDDSPDEIDESGRHDEENDSSDQTFVQIPLRTLDVNNAQYGEYAETKYAENTHWRDNAIFHEAEGLDQR